MSMPVAIKAGALYFGIVFAVAFILGTVRVIWIVPRIGARAAELAEMPVLLAVMIVAARHLVRRLAIPRAATTRLAMGAVALLLVLAFDFTVVLYLRGLTPKMYFETLDPVTGTAYYLVLGIFAATPQLFGGDA